ncbi:NUDIX hydrolase [Mesobacterium sp. TK19101]|uniref:NUDIX hydrolase n=2 Tax=Mesobacterium hydrothermale TaxID=3111907 RepID=A0ABU6HB93_9RHOB|nr:NUDIX hydrolase [Mesobacterium sp. TK19101]
MTEPFQGAKVMLFFGARLLVMRRDDKPGIPWPGFLDWPGGGREGDESPEACVLRETQEEIGLLLCPADLCWKSPYHRPGWLSWFFAAHLPAARANDIRFGNEGQGWMLIPPEAFLHDAKAIPHFRTMLDFYLGSCRPIAAEA